MKRFPDGTKIWLREAEQLFELLDPGNNRHIAAYLEQFRKATFYLGDPLDYQCQVIDESVLVWQDGNRWGIDWNYLVDPDNQKIETALIADVIHVPKTTHPVLCAWCWEEGVKREVGISSVAGSTGVCVYHRIQMREQVARRRGAA